MSLLYDAQCATATYVLLIPSSRLDGTPALRHLCIHEHVSITHEHQTVTDTRNRTFNQYDVNYDSKLQRLWTIHIDIHINSTIKHRQVYVLTSAKRDCEQRHPRVATAQAHPILTN